MVSDEQSNLWFRGKIVLIALSLAAISGALVVIYYAYMAFVESGAAPGIRRYMAGLAVVVVSLLLLALFCMGVLLIRYLAHRVLLKRTPSCPTEYTDAWKLAGERLQVPEDDEDDPFADDDDDDDDSDDLTSL